MSEMPGKMDLSTEYNLPLPDQYFSRLDVLNYRAFDSIATDVVGLLRRLQSVESKTRVLDLGCSYGTTTMQLRSNLTFSDLSNYFRHRGESGSVPKAIAVDKAFFGKFRHVQVEVDGIDASSAAIEYATKTRLLSRGYVAKFENGPIGSLSNDGEPIVMVGSGVLGYMSAAALGSWLDGLQDVPIAAVFTLARTLDKQAYLEACRQVPGFEAEVADPLLRQRRYVDRAEADSALGLISAAHGAPDALELGGWVFAQRLTITNKRCRQLLS